MGRSRFQDLHHESWKGSQALLWPSGLAQGSGARVAEGPIPAP